MNQTNTPPSNTSDDSPAKPPARGKPGFNDLEQPAPHDLHKE